RLDFVRRAHTAALNARLMPIIGRLFDAATEVLASVGVQAPLYIVRGDGSLLAVDAARQRPIETILSGPAASVVGARYLTGLDDLAVIDIGGTTTDVALVEGGQTAVGDEGAVVGSWRTSVTAAEIMTSGLGGDSVVALLDGGARLAIG
ncbi:MAG TPA: hydantoinase, partial [Armatimonadetes bacterium]|nr:hydantoinase [Armatimonadota bacterium]